MLADIKDVDHYISLQPGNVKARLKQLREAIKAAAPDAIEVISYNMPAYKFHGMLIYFAAHTNHIGLYPFASAIIKFNKELSKYQTAKGTVQFPNNKPIPFGLIGKMVKFRVKENLEKASFKAISRKKKQ